MGLASSEQRQPNTFFNLHATFLVWPVYYTGGDRGELSVLVDDRVVAKKWLLFKPSVEKVLAAVRGANQLSP